MLKSVVRTLIVFLFFANFKGFAGHFDEPLPDSSKLKPTHVVSIRVKDLGFARDAANPNRVILELRTRNNFKIYDKGLEFQYINPGQIPAPLVMRANPNAKEIEDPWYKEKRKVHENGATFLLTLSSKAMSLQGSIIVRFEACSVSLCLLPVKYQLQPVVGSEGVPLDPSVKPEGADPFGLGELALPTATNSEQKPAAQPSVAPTTNITTTPSDKVTKFVYTFLNAKSVWFFPALFLAGLMMNLTPCVYPMIPLTMSLLGRGRSANSKKERKIRSVFYFLGIVVSYSLMGLIAALTGTLFGSLLQNVFFTTSIAIVIGGLGFSMLSTGTEWAWLQNIAGRLPQSKSSPALGAFTLGSVAGIVAAPCTGPVLSLVLVLIAGSRDILYGLTLMLFLSLGYGLPYLILGFAAQGTTQLPKLSKALNHVKGFFASLMFGLALYYLKPLMEKLIPQFILFREPAGYLIVTVSVLLFVSLIAANFIKKNKVLFDRVGFVCISILSFWFTLMIMRNFSGEVATQNSEANTPKTLVRWNKDWKEAVELAKSSGKPILIDAWANWCVACLEMDADIWSDPEIAKVVNEKMIPVKIDFTEGSDLTEQITVRWELVGLPAVGFFTANSDIRTEKPTTLIRQAVTKDQFWKIWKEFDPSQK